MPNIIEQQDLLKGLTDQRLSMLMQQPTGDIPPFLVAAEAQRRQSIRAQFGGDPQANESVVDTLAKQMAGVPQNVNPNPAAPAAPPQMDQSQMMSQQDAGIAGLDQGMARGGMVRRYGTGGQVGYMPTMIRAPSNYLSSVGAVIPGMAGIYGVADWVGDKVSNAYSYLTTPATPAEQAVDAVEAEGYVDPFQSPERQAIRNGKAVVLRDKNAGKKNTSTENLQAPEVDKIRQRLEAFYSDNGVGSWDRAQKWFDVSQELLDPNATTGELISNAIGAFGKGMAEERRMEKQASRDAEEALLKYDISKQQEDEQTAAANLKARTDIATGQLDDLRRQQADIADRIRGLQKEIDFGSGTNIDVARNDQRALQAEMERINKQIAAYQNFISKTYKFSLIPTVNLETGQIEYPEQ